MIRYVKKQLHTYSRIEIAALTIFMLSAFLLAVLTNYGDINALLKTHVFYDSLFHGSIVHFYDNFDPNHNLHNCNLLGRLPLLIWYFPSWIATKVFIDDSSLNAYVTFYHQMWHKLFLAVMWLLCIKAMIGICKSVGKKESNKYCPLLMIASSEIILSVFFYGQDEIVYITFFMYALHHYILKNIKRYYFWSIASVVCCPLMLMPYLVITVIDDKKVYSIIGKFLLPIIPNLLYDIFFSQCIGYKYSGTTDYFGMYFLTNNIGMGHGTFSILAVILILFLAFAYFYNPNLESEDEKIKTILYIIVILFAALALFGEARIYRDFLWTPFAILLVVNYESFLNSKICYLLIVVMTTVQSIRGMYISGLVSNKSNGRLSALGYKIFGDLRYCDIPLLSSKTGIELTLLNSFLVGCLVLFAYFGRKKIDNNIEVQIDFDFVLLLCSMVLPLLLTYAFLRAYVIG